MTMNRKKLVILAAAAAGLLVLYLGISWYTGWSAEREAAEDAEKLKVTDLKKSEISRLSYSDGSTAMTFYKKSGKWHMSGEKNMDVDQDTVDEILDAYCQLSGTRKLSDPDDPEDYGFDSPAYTVTLTDKNGEKCELKIGDTAGSGYYITADGGKTVYTSDSTVTETLLFDEASFKAESED